MTASGKCRSRF